VKLFGLCTSICSFSTKKYPIRALANQLELFQIPNEKMCLKYLKKLYSHSLPECHFVLFSIQKNKNMKFFVLNFNKLHVVYILG